MARTEFKFYSNYEIQSRKPNIYLCPIVAGFMKYVFKRKIRAHLKNKKIERRAFWGGSDEKVCRSCGSDEEMRWLALLPSVTHTKPYFYSEKIREGGLPPIKGQEGVRTHRPPLIRACMMQLYIYKQKFFILPYLCMGQELFIYYDLSFIKFKRTHSKKLSYINLQCMCCQMWFEPCSIKNCAFLLNS